MFTVLVMYGGGDWAGAHRIVHDLLKTDIHCQIIVINGRNKRSYEAIEKEPVSEGVKLINLGFTDEVEKYMAASDAGITKAGGISTTEMINMGLPMIINRDVYGQERYNLDFLSKHGVCLSYGNAAELGECLIKCRGSQDDIIRNMRELRLPAARSIAELILR